MKRGEIWTAAGGKDYSGKPRPVVIIQDDAFNQTKSITVCSFTTNETLAPAFRLQVTPDDRNGLRQASRLMVDKMTSMPRTKLGNRIGHLGEADMLRLNQALLIFLGLAGSTSVRGAKHRSR